MSPAITVRVNGENRLVAAATLAELLAGLGIGAASRGVAVALNEHVVEKARWAATALGANDRIEIVRLLPGG